VPIAVVERGSLDSFNYMADTLMYCGTVLLLAGAMPREATWQEENGVSREPMERSTCG